MNRHKPSPAIVRCRTEEILRILLDGAESPWDTCAYVREKEAEPGSVWELPPGGKPLSDSQIRRYVAKANQLIAESCRACRKKLLRRHLAQRRNLYAKAVAQGDTRAALACLDSEAKLTGLFEIEEMRELEKQFQELWDRFERLQGQRAVASDPQSEEEGKTCTPPKTI